MINAILLAAGSGSRFGGDKLLAPLPNGTPVGVASLRNLAAAVKPCIAVVRTGDVKLRALLETEGARVVTCDDANQGMSRSLVAGIRATPGADGWVIALGDMPYISRNTITNVCDGLTRGALVTIPTFQGKRGHPVGFSSVLLDELLAIEGDEGARTVVKHHAGDCEFIECDDEGILRDIDTRTDLP